MEQECGNCRHLVRYTNDDGTSWMDVCEGDEADQVEAGYWLVAVMDRDEFDADRCFMFEAKEE